MSSSPVHPVLLEIEGMATAEGECVLGPLNLVTGPRGSGKSTKANALKFAFLGVVPHPERSEEYTTSLMRGPEMRVKVTLSDGRWFWRARLRKGDRIKGEAACSWLPEDAGYTEVGEAIRALAGASDVQARENLRAGALVAGSSQQLAARVDGILAVGSTPLEVQEKWLAALPVLRLSGLPEERWPEDPTAAETRGLSLLQDFTAAERGAFAAAHTEVRQVLQSKGAPDALAHATKRKNEENARVRGKTQARKEVEDRQGPAPAVTLDELAKVRQAKTDRIATLKAGIQARRDGEAARAKAVQALADAQARLSLVTKDGDVEQRAAALRQSAADLRAKALALVEPPPVAAPVLTEEDPTVEDRAQMLDEEARALTEQADAKTAQAPARPVVEPEPAVDAGQVDRARRALALAKQSPWTEVATIASGIAEVAPTEYLAQKAARLGVIAEVNGPGAVADHEAAVKAAEAGLAAQEAARAAVRERNAAAQATYSTTHAQWEFDQGAARGLRQQAGQKRQEATALRDAEKARLAKVHKEQQAAYRKAAVDRGVKADQVAQERRRLEGEAGMAETAARDLMREWTERAGAASVAQAHLDGMGEVAPMDVAAAEAEIAAVEGEVDAIDEQRRSVQAADARRTELAALATELASAQALAATWTEIEWALKRMRADDLRSRSGPLTDVMTRFLRAAGQPETPFLNADGGKVGLGWMRGGETVAIEALSGGEQVVALAALAAAVIGLRNPPLSFLMVEANEWGTDIPALLAGCEEVSGEIGCVLVCTNLKTGPREGWTHIEIAAPAAVGV